MIGGSGVVEKWSGAGELYRSLPSLTVGSAEKNFLAGLVPGLAGTGPPVVS
jgi:hypothetical protein